MRTLLNHRLVKFGLVGGTGYIVNALALEVFARYIFVEIILWAFATAVALMVIFALNHYWTFRSVGEGSVTHKGVKFLLTSSGAFVLQSACGALLVSFIGSAYRQLALILVIGCIIAPYNWYMYTRVVWKK